MPATTFATDPRDVPSPLRIGDPDSPRLWRLVVESRSWPVVLDPREAAPAVAAALDGPPQGFCARLDANALRGGLLRSAEQALAWPAPWALVLGLAHTSPVHLAELAARLPAYLLDPRTGRLIRLPGGNGQLVDAFLAAAWLDTEACVVANTTAALELVGAP
jgi:hypothetical protein